MSTEFNAHINNIGLLIDSAFEALSGVDEMGRHEYPAIEHCRTYIQLAQKEVSAFMQQGVDDE